jgi:hypothetical protein
MRVTLVAPNLLALPRAALAAVPALTRWASYADPVVVERAGLASAAIVAVRGARDTPVAPLAAAGAGLTHGDGFVSFAAPVALVAGRDDVLLAGRVDDLARDDADAIVATLNRHFAEDGLVFHAPRADAWFVVSRDAAPPPATPLPAVRGAIEPHLPRGDNGKVWRRWISEMQMLLHAHPVNEQRAEEGRALVTGLWIWGGGPRPAPATAPIAVFAAAGPVGDVARGLALQAGTHSQPPPAGFAELHLTTDAIVALPPIVDAAPLAQAWLEPALRALERKTLSQCALVTDGNGIAAIWTARTPSWRARLRARLAPRVFAPPADAEAT